MPSCASSPLESMGGELTGLARGKGALRKGSPGLFLTIGRQLVRMPPQGGLPNRGCRASEQAGTGPYHPRSSWLSVSTYLVTYLYIASRHPFLVSVCIGRCPTLRPGASRSLHALASVRYFQDRLHSPPGAFASGLLGLSRATYKIRARGGPPLRSSFQSRASRCAYAHTRSLHTTRHHNRASCREVQALTRCRPTVGVIWSWSDKSNPRRAWGCFMLLAMVAWRCCGGL